MEHCWAMGNTIYIVCSGFPSKDQLLFNKSQLPHKEKHKHITKSCCAAYCTTRASCFTRTICCATSFHYCRCCFGFLWQSLITRYDGTGTQFSSWVHDVWTGSIRIYYTTYWKYSLLLNLQLKDFQCCSIHMPEGLTLPRENHTTSTQKKTNPCIYLLIIFDLKWCLFILTNSVGSR